ncbi:hypothetical protein [Aestuariivita boseongensis]|uniref:hypothetical protein n=1 Tax=Aestuariivita boseongensis TaxID=1470562 RepID=UPI000682F084|nr:hypothetical protein [Aestuariivita boseongensis]
MAEDPTNPKVQSLATKDGALDTHNLSLIGTMGTEALPRALVRFPNGRIEKVTVGDSLRGNRIDAIEPERLLMSRNGRQSILQMPQG